MDEGEPKIRNKRKIKDAPHSREVRSRNYTKGKKLRISRRRNDRWRKNFSEARFGRLDMIVDMYLERECEDIKTMARMDHMAEVAHFKYWNEESSERYERYKRTDEYFDRYVSPDLSDCTHPGCLFPDLCLHWHPGCQDYCCNDYEKCIYPDLCMCCSS